MNWGNKILLLVILFVGGMSYMVSVAMRQTNEMMDDNYYQKELAHQSVIDATNNYHSLIDTVAVMQDEQHLLIRIPAQGKAFEGDIQFIRPANQSLDTNFAIGNQNIIQVPISAFQKGLYLMKINWTLDHTSYHFERELIIE